jgi:PmbA protein
MSEIAPHSASALPDKARLEELVTDTLAVTGGEHVTAAETAVSFTSALSATVRLGEVETLEHHRNRSLAVTVYFGHRKGSASTSDWRPQAIRETVRAACDIARHTATDPCAGLAEPQRLARDVLELNLCHPWAVSTEQAIDLARNCEATALAFAPQIRNSDGATVASQASLFVYGNSNGFCGGYPSTRHYISCSVIGEDDKGMQRDHWYSIARDPGDLEPATGIGRRAAERTLRRLNSRRLNTREAPVIFAADVARGMIGHFIGAIRGGALYRKASILVDHLGRQVFPTHVNIREEPHLPKALGSAPFDGEGVVTAPRDLVHDGVLQGYVLDSYAACRLGMQTTGNAGGVHNVVVNSDGLTFEDLLRHMDTGLLVTELMGHGINLVTGDYSRGASGFWVEGGEIRYPVEEITIAGNLRNMFAGIVAIATDMDTRGNIRCGSVLIEPMTIAGE